MLSDSWASLIRHIRAGVSKQATAGDAATGPRRGPPSEAATDWVDRHLVLNYLSVMIYRGQSAPDGLLPMVEHVTAYLSSGFYFERRGALADASFFFDWLRSSIALTGAVAMEPFSAEVTWDELPDDPIDFTAARAFAASLLGAVADGKRLRPRSIVIRQSDRDLGLQFSIEHEGSAADLTRPGKVAGSEVRVVSDRDGWLVVEVPAPRSPTRRRSDS